jgi:uncharacterized iron-regulated membrane protein
LPVWAARSRVPTGPAGDKNEIEIQFHLDSAGRRSVALRANEIEIQFQDRWRPLSLRRSLFWMHLALGVVSGLVVLLMSVTGVLLAFEKQVVALVDGRAVRSSAGPRLGVEALLARAAAESPGTVPGRVTLRAAPAPVEVSLGRDALLLDPVTGRRIEGGPAAARAFFREVTAWHRWLALPPALRDSGRAVTGACTLMFLGLLLSGPVLWWPRGGASAWKTALFFRRGLGKARHFNWHNVAGIWMVLPLVVVVASALVISYPWASDLVYRAAGEAPPPRNRPGAPGGPGARGGSARGIDAAGLDVLVAAAHREVPAWRILTITPPAPGAKSVNVSIDTSGGGRPQTRTQLTFDRTGAALLASEGYGTQGAGRRARSWLRFLHTGEALGLTGQAVAGVASAAAVLLVYTGLSLAYRRGRAWQRARARHDDVVSAVAPGTAGLDFSGGSR